MLNRTGLVLSALCLLPCAALATPSLTQQRLYYSEAKKALEQGDAGVYRRYQSQLQGYPLLPYLTEIDLNRRVKNAGDEEIETFLDQYGDIPQSRWLRLRWLKRLADQGNWTTFGRYYTPNSELVEMDCLQGQYLYATRQPQAAATLAGDLYVQGKALPKTCDSLLERWRAAEGPSDAQRWARLTHAALAGQTALAREAASGLTAESRKSADLMLQVAQSPALLNQPTRLKPANQQMADVAAVGLRRMSAEDPARAAALWPLYKNYPYSDEQRLGMAKDIGIKLARKFDPRALPVLADNDPNASNEEITSWRLRLLLREERWSDAQRLTQQLPTELANTPRWRYWRLRTQEMAQPDSASVHTGYQSLAGERDYYGFLAAERVNATYNLSHTPLKVTPKTLEQVRQVPAIQRALELEKRGELLQATREWNQAAQGFSREEQLAQAQLAYDQGWYLAAIRSLAKANYWEDLDIRFPMAHKDLLTREAKRRDLHPSWVFAITRQESAFMPEAKSGSGAMGLMQLMPATAKETAQRNGIALSAPQAAYEPHTNVQLGTAYLGGLNTRFQGNRILASAAYNAGPGRVKQWLSETSHMPADIWVETIPFDETRQYVQNVLTYSVIYGKKLDTPQPIMEASERDLTTDRN